jgi:hypothetical protein
MFIDPHSFKLLLVLLESWKNVFGKLFHTRNTKITQ